MTDSTKSIAELEARRDKLARDKRICTLLVILGGIAAALLYFSCWEC